MGGSNGAIIVQDSRKARSYPNLSTKKTQQKVEENVRLQRFDLFRLYSIRMERVARRSQLKRLLCPHLETQPALYFAHCLRFLNDSSVHEGDLALVVINRADDSPLPILPSVNLLVLRVLRGTDTSHKDTVMPLKVVAPLGRIWAEDYQHLMARHKSKETSCRVWQGHKLIHRLQTTSCEDYVQEYVPGVMALDR